MRAKQAMASLAAIAIVQGAILSLVLAGLGASPLWRVIAISCGAGLASSLVFFLVPFLILAAKGHLGIWSALLIGVVEAIALTAIDALLSGRFGFIGLVLSLGLFLPTTAWSLIGGACGWLAWKAMGATR